MLAAKTASADLVGTNASHRKAHQLSESLRLVRPTHQVRTGACRGAPQRLRLGDGFCLVCCVERRRLQQGMQGQSSGARVEEARLTMSSASASVARKFRTRSICATSGS